VDTENSPLVDVEVCRSLGLRSIAVIPIQGWRGINGILEVFATVPGAFSEHDLALLDQLAALAERARATQPHGASPVSAQPPAEMPRPAGMLPASDRVRDVVLAFMGGQSRPVVLGAVGLAALLLVALVIWLGWHGSGDSDGKAHAAAPGGGVAIVQPGAGRIPDNDPVWKPNPGGVALLSPGGKTSAGTPVKMASEIELIEGSKAHEDSSLLAADAANIALPHAAGASGATSDASSGARTNGEAGATVEVEPPVLAAEQADSTALNQVLMAKATVPGFTAPVSQGVSGGRLIHRVSPTYPAQAKLQRVEGKVVISALVREDGGVSDLKILGGPPALAQSAMEAVKQWRFDPFVLNGKAIQRETTITIDFKLPSAGR
jgi:protein TonB